SIAANPQGTYTAALWGSKGRLWQTQTQEILSVIPAAPTLVWNEDVAFSTDGKTLVTCGHDTRARFWSVDDRSGDTLTATLPSIYHPMQLLRVNLTSDGQHLATALWDGRVCLWRSPSSIPTAYSTLAGGATSAALSPDGRFVLPRGVTYRDGTRLTTQVYNAETGKCAGPIIDPGGILLDAAFSPDGTRVVTASSSARTPALRNQNLFEPDGKSGNVQIWDWKNGTRVVGPIPTPSEPRGIAFRPDSRTLAVVCADYRVVLVDPGTGAVTQHLDPGVRTRPRNANLWLSNGEARFNPDGQFLVTWEMTPQVHVWDPDGGRLIHTLAHNDRVFNVAFHPTDPELIATCGLESVTRIWNMKTGKLVVALNHPQWVNSVQFSPDGTELIACSNDGFLRLWDWKAGKLKDGWALHSTIFGDPHITADRRWLVTQSPGSLQVTDWRSKTPVSPQWNLKPNFNLAMDIPNGRHRVIVGGFSGSLVGYDLELMSTPVDGSIQNMVELAEVAAGRRILDQGNIVPLNSTEWAERWLRAQKTLPLLFHEEQPMHR
ncbi:MAG TPA: WD40 repeat domain-containing protein, partial [Gemmata sp.]|nr:WD40 repeat domain-containing protein [Gemmata sp.]